MGIKQSFFLAVKSLLTSKVRALLTMLGIIIGVAAVIVIISLGDGMTKMMNDQFESMGANLIQVQVWDFGSSRSVSPEDMYEVMERNPKYLKAVTPYVSVGSMSVHSEEETFTPKSIMGGSEDYASIQNITLERGRFLQYIDVLRQQKVCVIGSYINKEYYDGDALGKTLGLGGYTYTIVGVLTESAESRKATDDDQIIIPYTNAMYLSGNRVQGYLFTGASKETAAISRSILENRLLKIFGDDDYYMVVTSAEMLDMMNTMMGTMMTVLVAIAAISLLVGGIGIMNIMLVSVSERTREIGIRKSLGAKRKDIRGQFIIEAGTTSAIGGVIGIGLGLLMANGAGALISSMDGAEGFSAVPSISAIAIAFGVSVGVGIVFGYLPANKAAKLNPIDALRYE